MTGIGGFKLPELPTLPANDVGEQFPLRDAKTYDLTIPGPLPDTDGVPPKQLFDALADLIKEHGSDDLKKAVENGDKFVLKLQDQAGNIADFLIDATNGLAYLLAGNENPRDPSDGTVSCWVSFPGTQGGLLDGGTQF